MIFEDRGYFEKVKEHYMKFPREERHSHINIVIGEWRPSNDGEASIECSIGAEAVRISGLARFFKAIDEFFTGFWVSLVMGIS